MSRDRDSKWVNQSLRGDKRAFGMLVEQYQSSALSIALKLMRHRQESEDVLQESFIKAYKNLHRFDTTLKFSTWLFRIVTNQCIDRLRAKKTAVKMESAEIDRMEWIIDRNPTPEQYMIQHETKKQTEQLIAALPPSYRAVVILRYERGLAIQEIADILEIPLNTAKTRIHRAREIMRAKVTSRTSETGGEPNAL